MIRVYWVQLYYLVNKTCLYLQRNKNRLPTDLQGPAASALVGIVTFCDILAAYDATHPRGRGANEP